MHEPGHSPPKTIQATCIPIAEDTPSRGNRRIRYFVQGKGTLHLTYGAEKAKNLNFEIEID